MKMVVKQQPRNKRKNALTPEKSSRINGFWILAAEWGRNVGVFRRILIKYCIFNGYAVFNENAQLL